MSDHVTNRSLGSMTKHTHCMAQHDIICFSEACTTVGETHETTDCTVDITSVLLAPCLSTKKIWRLPRKHVRHFDVQLPARSLHILIESTVHTLWLQIAAAHCLHRLRTSRDDQCPVCYAPSWSCHSLASASITCSSGATGRTNPVQTWVAPWAPAEGVHSCPSSVDASTTTGALRNSRASRLVRLVESARIQASEPLPDAGN